jgi:hypothetical protein
LVVAVALYDFDNVLAFISYLCYNKGNLVLKISLAGRPAKREGTKKKNEKNEEQIDSKANKV